MKIIGLTGVAGAGKDTVAQMVIDLLPDLRVAREGFADKLKLSAARLFMPDCDLERALEWCNLMKGYGYIAASDCDGLAPELGINGREFLQRFGTEAHRDVFGVDFWLDAVLPEGRDDCDLLVIPDVRFANEAQRVRDRGGHVWHIDRPGTAAANGHVSERPVVSNYTICNNACLDSLRERVADALEVYSIGTADNVEGA